MKLDVIVSVSDKYLWCLQPFAAMFNKYWSPDQQVIVAGYTPPDFRLPHNFKFYSIDVPGYPKEKWGDGLMHFFDVYQKSYFVLLLEDYWISRPVDLHAIDVLSDYMAERPNLLRMDLTADRQFAGGARTVGYVEHYDLIEAPGSQYQMSMQAGIWNHALLSSVLHALNKDNRNPWDVEMVGTTIVNNHGDRMRVFGTKQCPVRYANALNNASGKKVFYENMTPEDIHTVSQLIPEDYK